MARPTRALFAAVALVVLFGGCEAEILPRTALRPNLYFGTREKLPDAEAMQTSLAWLTRLDKMRLECRHEDGLERWGWEENDGLGYGLELLRDPEQDLELSVEYLAGSESDFGVRVNGSHLSKQPMMSVLIAFACPTGARVLDDDVSGIAGDSASVSCGNHRLDMFWGPPDSSRPFSHHVCTERTVRVHNKSPPEELDRTHFTSFDVHPLEAWNYKALVMQKLLESHKSASSVSARLASLGATTPVPLLDDQAQPHHKLVVLQRVFVQPDFSFRAFLKRVVEPETSMEEAFMVGLAQRQDAFQRDLLHRFNLSSLDRQSIAMASYAVSNLLGSHGYFFGGNMVAGVRGDYRPGSLLAGVPSRSFFPRGFLWDEGFQLLITGTWSKALATEVLMSWLSRMDENGWIAREQILGAEAASRVPAQFQIQNQSFANPPTLLFALKFIDDMGLLMKAYRHFCANYQWLVTSQNAPKHSNAFAWVGRSADGRHTLTSGIDDFPRGYGGYAPYEAHVDLLSWVAWMEGVLADTALRLGLDDEASNFRAAKRMHLRVLQTLHWDDERKWFCDIGVVDDLYPLGLGHQQQGAPLQQPLQPVVAKVLHFGYVGLLPFALGLISSKDTVKLDAVLLAMEDPQRLRAEGVGLRSLSRSDPLYSTDEDYWRGAVWININYLCIRALDRYSGVAEDEGIRSRAAKLRDQLRADVIGNVKKQWVATGFLFENYDASTGAGRGTRPFTGWSSLVVLLMGKQALGEMN